MKIDIELGKVKLRVPENKNDLPVNVIVGDGGGVGPGPGSGSYIKYLIPSYSIINTTIVTASMEVTE